ncbi:hypothetical protein PHET_07996 [Paragonimus heterotremus]|uniref:Rho-GAP domain-containing protein n=1 Tax=Paragonimus heterotremus TaxID=100268 RepID=A0A8J4T4Y1_9TREM|nr:hypothetical protein PHET_07996 [Paragonimus heterotremus]
MVVTRRVSERYNDPQEIRNYIQKLGTVDKSLIMPDINCLPAAVPKNTLKCQQRKRVATNTTEKVLDPTPTTPTREDPSARAHSPFRRMSARKFVVYLTAAGLQERQQRLDPDAFEKRRLMKQNTMRHRSTDPSQLKNDVVSRKRLLSQPLSLITFQPFLAPFVPDLLRLLVNGVESYCYEHSWSAVYSPLNEYYNEAVLAFRQLIDISHDPRATKKLIGRIQHPIKILVIRLFLNELGMKPLHFNRSLMYKLSQSPLFDFFLRPHPGLKKLVQNAALQSSCGHVDTLAFLMVHLLHAWEYADNPLAGKLKLAAIYGHLLISFVEKPELRGSGFGEGRTIESAILEVLLETCDYHFWNQLTVLKIRVAFDQESQMDKHRILSERQKRHESSLLFSAQSMVGPRVSERELRSVENDPFKSLLQILETSKGSSSKSDNLDTPKEIQSIESNPHTEDSSEYSVLPKPIPALPALSFISEPVPHLLQLAEVGLNTAKNSGRWAFQRNFPSITKLRSPSKVRSNMCRSTAELVRCISRWRNNRLVYHNKTYKRVGYVTHGDSNIWARIE